MSLKFFKQMIEPLLGTGRRFGVLPDLVVDGPPPEPPTGNLYQMVV